MSQDDQTIFQSKRILLIQTAYIGDVILTTPLIQGIREFFPEARLSILVKPEAKSLLEHDPALDEVLIIEKRGKHRGPSGFFKFVKEIQTRDFDLLLSVHKSFRTAFLSYLSGIPVRIGFQDASLSFLAYTRTVPHRKEKPEIHRLLSFLEDATGKNTGSLDSNLRLHSSEQVRNDVDRLMTEQKIRRPILFAVSSVWETKKWTPEGFAGLMELIRKRTSLPFALIGSPGDRELSDRVMDLYKQLPGGKTDSSVFNLCGKTSLPGLYELMRKSELLISNDSAPVHVACAARIPVLAIFGPTVPSFGFAPITPESAVAELEGLDCRPCGSHGGRSCPRKHFRCMRDLTAESVFQRIQTIYSFKE